MKESTCQLETFLPSDHTLDLERHGSMETDQPMNGESIYEKYLLLRKDFFLLTKRDTDIFAVSKLRNECRQFLKEICDITADLSRGDQAFNLPSTTEKLWLCMKGILLRVDTLFAGSSSKSSAIGNHDRNMFDNVVLHLQLDCLMLCVTFASKLPDSQEFKVNSPIFDDVRRDEPMRSHLFSFVLLEFYKLIVIQYTKTFSKNEMRIFSEELFPCDCALRGLLLVQKVASADAPETNPVAACILSLLRLSDHFKHVTNPQDLPSTDFISFNVGEPVGSFPIIGLLILYHLTSMVDPVGSFGSGSWSSGSFYSLLLGKIMTPIFSALDSQWNEARARLLVTCAAKCQSVFGISTDVMAKLAEFFMRNLDRIQVLESSSNDQFATSTEPKQWASKWLTFQPTVISQLDAQRKTSFELLLISLAWTLERCPELWNRIRVPILSNLGPRNLQSLSTSAITRLFDLLLAIIGRIPDTNDIVAVLSSLPVETSAYTREPLGRVLVSWKGLITIVILQVERNADPSCASKLAKKLSEDVDALCKFLKLNRGNAVIVRNVWTALNVYFDAAEELLRQNIGIAAVLLSVGLGELLTGVLDITKASKLTAFLSDVVTTAAQLYPLSLRFPPDELAKVQAFWSAVFSNLLPAVKRSLASRSPQSESFCQICVLCTEAKARGFATSSRDSLLSLVQFLGYTDEIPAEFASLYLSGILDSGLSDSLSTDNQFVPKVLHTWFRCSIELGEENSNVKLLLRSMSDSPNFVECFDLTSHHSALESLLERFGSDYDKDGGFENRMVLQQKFGVIVGNLKKYLDDVITKSTGDSQVENAVKVAGLVFRHCSRHTYSKSKVNCLLRQLVDSILLGAEKNQAVARALRKHLSGYLVGFSRLDTDTDGQLRELFSSVLRSLLTCCAGDGFSLEYLVKATRETCSVSPHFRSIVIQVVCTSFLMRNPAQQTVNPALSFLSSVLDGAEEEHISDSMDTLFPCCVEQCMKGQSRTRMEAESLLTKLLTVTSWPSGSEDRSKLVQFLRKVSITSVGAFAMQLFRVLKLVGTHRQGVLDEILPFLSNQVKNNVSISVTAREAYLDLLKNMGPAGQSQLQHFA